MKVVLVNGGIFGSTYSICLNLLKKIKEEGDEGYYCSQYKKPSNFKFNYIRIGNPISTLINKIFTHIDGSDGFRNHLATRLFIKKLKKIKPDVVHLHTLHGSFINIPLLIKYLKKNNIKTIITLHDCFYFTGRCSFYKFANCDKWQNECGKCSNKKIYPVTYIFDKSKKYLAKKVELFKDFNNLTICCVSNWLRDECIKSKVFKDKNIITVYNGVDENEFNIRKDDFKNHSILAVAGVWSKNKGIDLLLEIAKEMKNRKFVIIGRIPEGITLPLNVTNRNVFKFGEKMSHYYGSSDLLLNTSMGETFSLVNIEAQLSGTPIVCMNISGMKETSSETLTIYPKEYSKEAFIDAIDATLELNTKKEKIREFALKFSLAKMKDEYYKLYK